jgi:hypothetical protein
MRIRTKELDITLDENKLRIFLNTPHSGDSKDLWKALEKAKIKAVLGAKRMVGVRTGTLRDSIVGRHLGNYTGQYLWIGSERGYALDHHEGTKPHIIKPDTAKVLRFVSKGQVIYTPIVKHPGTKANHYLSRQLHHFRKIR